MLIGELREFINRLRAIFVLPAKDSRTDMQTKPAIALEFRFGEELVDCGVVRKCVAGCRIARNVFRFVAGQALAYGLIGGLGTAFGPLLGVLIDIGLLESIRMFAG